jgi:hypothetical protein
MGKLEAKALFYIELNGGFVRLSLRPIQFHIVSIPSKPLSCNGFFVLWCFSKVHIVSPKVSVLFQDFANVSVRSKMKPPTGEIKFD